MDSAFRVSPVNTDARKALDMRAGDTVRVHQKIKEKGKFRIQIFEGLVLGRKHGTEAGATFTVRKVTSGVGVEKIYPLYSPMIEKIEVVKRSKARRAKLYHVRRKAAKEVAREMRRLRTEKEGTVTEVSEGVVKEEAPASAKEKKAE